MRLVAQKIQTWIQPIPETAKAIVKVWIGHCSLCSKWFHIFFLVIAIVSKPYAVTVCIGFELGIINTMGIFFLCFLI